MNTLVDFALGEDVKVKLSLGRHPKRIFCATLKIENLNSKNEQK